MSPDAPAPPAPAAGHVGVAVVIPMFNAERLIERIVAPLKRMLDEGTIDEIIVVDDNSTDGSAEVVRKMPFVRLAATAQRGGPGAARNRGAELTTCRYLWFVDSDVVVADDAGRVLQATLAQTGAESVIGSYDDTPEARNFLSQYKNLVHHYYHHRGKAQASTFWGGCGAVDREFFLKIGGFDTQRYLYPSIEDIELGYRITDAGGRIVLDRRLQGKHLKVWRLGNLLHTEIFRRALPWSRLLLERRDITDDLNVARGERVRALIAGVTVLAALGWMAGLVPGLVFAAVVAGMLAANAAFLRFFTTQRGVFFALRALAFHQFYYLYSGMAFAAATAEYRIGSLLPGRRAAG